MNYETHAYRIKDWNKHFENNKTRTLVTMRWIPIPADLNDDGYIVISEHDNGAAHFGVWIALVELAATCKPRGTLVTGAGTGMSPRQMARKTRFPEPLIVETLARLVDPELEWMEIICLETSGTVVPESVTKVPPEVQSSTSTEQSTLPLTPPSGGDSVYPDFEKRKWINITPEMVENWKKSYPKVDVIAELRASFQWADDNKDKPKGKKKDWKRFVSRWLSRHNKDNALADRVTSIARGSGKGSRPQPAKTEEHNDPDGLARLERIQKGEKS